jgi:hypothetical protein
VDATCRTGSSRRRMSGCQTGSRSGALTWAFPPELVNEVVAETAGPSSVSGCPLHSDGVVRVGDVVFFGQDYEVIRLLVGGLE